MVELHLHIDTTALFTGTALLAAVAYLLFVQVKSLIPSLVASSMQLVFEKLSHDEEVICAGAVKRLTHIDDAVNESVTSLLKSEEFHADAGQVLAGILRDDNLTRNSTELVLEAVKVGVQTALSDDELHEMIIRLLRTSMVAASKDEQLKASMKGLLIEVFSDQDVTSALVKGGMGGTGKAIKDKLFGRSDK